MHNIAIAIAVSKFSTGITPFRCSLKGCAARHAGLQPEREGCTDASRKDTCSCPENTIAVVSGYSDE